jgi:hypothetical protein
LASGVRLGSATTSCGPPYLPGFLLHTFLLFLLSTLSGEGADVAGCEEGVDVFVLVIL